MAQQLPHPVTGKLFTSPVPPGRGWPGDPATARTPVAHSAAEVTELADGASLAQLDARISVCSACPRLVAWREDVARTKRASFADQPYWGRPVPGWGDPRPGILVVGLAPAANGANRTGRNFTGDSSGDWLFASLHRVGLATRATSVSAGDGQQLLGVRLVATVRCAPPQNKPTPAERDTCSPWIAREIDLTAAHVRAVVCLGAYGWTAALKSLAAAGYEVPRPAPKFGHGRELVLERVAGRERERLSVIGCYHPSQHNTFTGRLTEAMLDQVFVRARALQESTA